MTDFFNRVLLLAFFSPQIVHINSQFISINVDPRENLGNIIKRPNIRKVMVSWLPVRFTFTLSSFSAIFVAKQITFYDL